jgi:hypothetical protein
VIFPHPGDAAAKCPKPPGCFLKHQKLKTMRTFLTILLLWPLALWANSGVFYAYSVHPDSRISIQGTTNVNSFECVSDSNLPRGYIIADPHPEKDAILFSDASLGVAVKSFDCQHRVMNRDFQRALGVEKHPNIEIKLLETQMVYQNPAGTGGILEATVAIALNGVEKKTEVTLDFRQTEGFNFLFEGAKVLKMSDFKVDPPSPAMGLIRVRDEITIQFNLLVEAGLITQN